MVESDSDMAKKETKKETKQHSHTLQRTPIVAVLGHVDHGKTTLLDTIRGTKVQASEVGGITQSVRAHEVEFNGQKITFIDTPGHEAFSDMRSRGADVTDIALLVISAADGIQPQTKESIKFAKRSGVPIVVAATKMDLPGANLDKIKQELSQNDVLVEDYGGDTIIVPVSAVKKEGIDDLLETLILVAEIGEIKNAEVEAGTLGQGIVLESTLDKNKGPVALVLIKKGGLKVGDFIQFEGGYSKVRALLDEYQKPDSTANVSEPVWVVGLAKVISTGEVVTFLQDEKIAKQFVKDAAKRKSDDAAAKLVAETSEEEPAIGEDNLALLAGLLEVDKEEEDKKKLNVVIKTDAQGSLEAVVKEFEKLNDKEVEVNILSKGTGEISEKDVETAKNARGIVLGFRVNLPKDVESYAKKEKVLVRSYEIIYEMVDEIDAALTSLLEPEEEEIEVARAKVKMVFTLSNGDVVAGSEVTKGKIIRGYKVFVERAGEEIGRGKITSLKQKKSEVKEIDKGLDCGIFIEPKVDIQEGDEIVAYKVEKY